MKRHKIAPELKEQIINRIKNEGVSVVQAAKDHGVAEESRLAVVIAIQYSPFVKGSARRARDLFSLS